MTTITQPTVPPARSARAHGGDSSETLSSGPATPPEAALFARSLARVTAHSLSRSTLVIRRAALHCTALWVALGLGLLAPGCSNGVGSNCEISQDCASGLTCCTASCASPARGTCQASCDGVVCVDAGTSDVDAFGSTETDAFTPSEPDAFAPTPDAFTPSTPDAFSPSAPDAAPDVDGGT